MPVPVSLSRTLEENIPWECSCVSAAGIRMHMRVGETPGKGDRLPCDAV